MNWIKEVFGTETTNCCDVSFAGDARRSVL